MQSIDCLISYLFEVWVSRLYFYFLHNSVFAQKSLSLSFTLLAWDPSSCSPPRPSSTSSSSISSSSSSSTPISLSPYDREPLSSWEKRKTFFFISSGLTRKQIAVTQEKKNVNRLVGRKVKKVKKPIQTSSESRPPPPMEPNTRPPASAAKKKKTNKSRIT